jgi:hypothetical protein
MSGDGAEEAIQVAVRLRPEADASEGISLTVQDDQSLRLSVPKRGDQAISHQETEKYFCFDKVFGPESLQSEVRA